MCSTSGFLLAAAVMQRADRKEESLSRQVGVPGEPLPGDVLATGSRGQLRQWMEDCVTGLERLRSGLPAGWRSAVLARVGELVRD
jgi:hypothetical protein